MICIPNIGAQAVKTSLLLKQSPIPFPTRTHTQMHRIHRPGFPCSFLGNLAESVIPEVRDERLASLLLEGPAAVIELCDEDNSGGVEYYEWLEVPDEPTHSPRKLASLHHRHLSVHSQSPLSSSFAKPCDQ